MFRSLLNALVACIRKHTFLFTVQKVVRLGNIVFICGGGVNTVDYRRAIINANVRLHTNTTDCPSWLNAFLDHGYRYYSSSRSERG